MTPRLRDCFEPTRKDTFDNVSGNLFIADPFDLKYSSTTIKKIRDIKFDKEPVVALPYGLLYSRPLKGEETGLIDKLKVFLSLESSVHNDCYYSLFNQIDMRKITSPYLSLIHNGVEYKSKLNPGHNSWICMEEAIYEYIENNSLLKAETDLEDPLILIGDAKVYGKENVKTIDVLKGNFHFWFNPEDKMVKLSISPAY